MKRAKQPAVYIMASQRNGTLYVGVTSNIVRRIYEHGNGLIDGFSKKYKCHLLVFYELHSTMAEAINREKYLKKLPRNYKLCIIELFNSGWEDLYEKIANYK